MEGSAGHKALQVQQAVALAALVALVATQDSLSRLELISSWQRQTGIFQ
jgi:hypothetical protein